MPNPHDITDSYFFFFNLAKLSLAIVHILCYCLRKCNLNISHVKCEHINRAQQLDHSVST